MTKKPPPTHTEHSLRKQVESIKRQKIVSKKVVSLADFRELNETIVVRSILVVDDDEVMRNALKRILENEGYNVLLAVDGLEYSRLVENSHIDLIIMDVNLPWVDGYDLCRITKTQSRLKDVPVIMVSARKAKEDIQSGFDSGCSEYVTKPFDVDYITSIINRVLPREGA